MYGLNFSKCRQHPSYSGDKPPVKLCPDCWRLYTHCRAYHEEEAEDQARSQREDRASR